MKAGDAVAVSAVHGDRTLIENKIAGVVLCEAFDGSFVAQLKNNPSFVIPTWIIMFHFLLNVT